MNVRRKIILSIVIGLLAGISSLFIPRATVLDNVPVADLAIPILGLRSFLSGHSAYVKCYYDTIPAVTYPFTTMMALYPFLYLPLKMVVPFFCTIISAIFAYSLLYDNKPWRLLILLSVPYLSSLQSVQFVPLLSAAVSLSSILPVVVLKPQLGIILLAAGEWSRKTFLTAIMIVIVSLAIYPTWPIDWLKDGNLSYYDGKMPVFQGIGPLLLFSLFKWREKRGRLLLAMSLIPQRIWYDQLMLFLIPKTRPQLYVLLIGSYLSLLLTIIGGWPRPGLQDAKSWNDVVSFVYIPALVMIYLDEIVAKLNSMKRFVLALLEK